MPFRVFAPFAFGYFMSYLFRSVNAVTGPELSADLGVEPAALGLLTSVYFLTFAAIQLPLGVVLDRYPAHKVEATLLVFAAAGSALFAVAENIAVLTIGRALIGVGVSACLMAAFKAYSTMVSVERLPLVNGLHLAVGGLGLLSGGLPSELAIGLVGWRGLFLGLAALSLVEAVALLLFAATPRGPASGASVASQFRDVGRILVSRPFLGLAPVAMASQMTALSLQTLWAGPWLRDVAGFPAASAALILSAMALATTIGFLVAGAVAAAFARRGVRVASVAAVWMGLFMLTQPVILLLPPHLTVGAWIAFAFLAGSGTLGFPALTASYPPALTGRVNTALNFVVFIAAFLAQWAVGVAVELLVPSIGTQASYATAIAALIVIQVATLAWFITDLRRP